jgi:hypothetical protein
VAALKQAASKSPAFMRFDALRGKDGSARATRRAAGGGHSAFV